MEGSHLVSMAGKLILRFPEGLSHVVMRLLVVLHDSLKVGGEVVKLLRQFAHLGSMLHVPLLQRLGVLLLELGNQCRQVCTFVYTDLHVSAIP